MILQASNIHLYFNDSTILNGVSVAVSRGELIGLIGPNGAGKTSLLRILANLQKPSAGTLQINNQAINSINKKQFAQWVGYLEQGAPVHWPLQVRRLIELGRLPHLSPWRGLSTKDREIIQQAMAAAEVTHLAERIVTTLSGGERLRVLIARLFATQPTIILADEPIAALDPYHQLHTMELLRTHCQRGGSAVVVMHDLNTAARFCDRLIMLHHGKIVSDDRPNAVLTAEHLKTVYGIDADIHPTVDNGIMVVAKNRIPH